MGKSYSTLLFVEYLGKRVVFDARPNACLLARLVRTLRCVASQVAGNGAVRVPCGRWSIGACIAAANRPNTMIIAHA